MSLPRYSDASETFAWPLLFARNTRLSLGCNNLKSSATGAPVCPFLCFYPIQKPNCVF
jgi:hypothetical protein